MRKNEKKLKEEAEAARKAARWHIVGILAVAVGVALAVWTYVVNIPTTAHLPRPKETIVNTPEMQQEERDYIQEKSQAISFEILDWKEAGKIGDGLMASFAGAGTKFISLKVKATNTGKDKIFLAPMDLGLVADNGASYPALTSLGGKTPPLNSAIAPGKSAVGMLAFEVGNDVRHGQIGFLTPVGHRLPPSRVGNTEGNR